MNAAVFILSHVRRIRCTGLAWQSWAALLILEVHGENWQSRDQIIAQMSWLPTANPSDVSPMIAPLLERGLIEKKQIPCRTRRLIYRITPEGSAFLKLPTAKAKEESAA